MSLFKQVTAIMAGLIAVSAHAETAQPNQLEQFMKQNGVELVHTMPIEDLQGLNLDLYLTTQGAIYYDSEKQVIFSGSSPKKLINNNIVDMERSVRLMFIDRMEEKIVAKAPNERTKITVVADITCGWCQKLHNELPQYMDAGVSVEFVLHSNSGLDSQPAKVMSAILKQDDPLKALDDAYAGQLVAPDSEVSEVMKSNRNIMSMLGVTGTPVIFLEDGTMIDRYIPASILAKEL